MNGGSIKQRGKPFFVRGWIASFLDWLRLKKLEGEFRKSQKFQRECERLHCFNLARLEEESRGHLAIQIAELRK